MEIFSEELQYEERIRFAIEMIILNRNKNGATLAEIHDDLANYFGLICETIWGYKCMEQYFRPMLHSGVMDIYWKRLDDGCVLYYMDIDAAIRKLSSNLSEDMTLILEELEIDLHRYLGELKEISRKKSKETQQDIANSSSESSKNTSQLWYSNNIRKSTSTEECAILEHMLIGDNFFLEIATIDLRRQYTRTRIKQVGQCVSGQSLKRALKNITRVINAFRLPAAVINLGSVDLLQGREVVDMMEDMYRLCQLLVGKDIYPIVTTIPPLANQMHNQILEHKRKLFNAFLIQKFDCIDIQDGFYSNCNRVSFNQYQSDARRVGGTKCPLVLWSNVARQRVLKKLKTTIPEFHSQDSKCL